MWFRRISRSWRTSALQSMLYTMTSSRCSSSGVWTLARTSNMNGTSKILSSHRPNSTSQTSTGMHLKRRRTNCELHRLITVDLSLISNFCFFSLDDAAESKRKFKFFPVERTRVTWGASAFQQSASLRWSTRQSCCTIMTNFYKPTSSSTASRSTRKSSRMWRTHN